MNLKKEEKDKIEKIKLMSDKEVQRSIAESLTIIAHKIGRKLL